MEPEEFDDLRHAWRELEHRDVDELLLNPDDATRAALAWSRGAWRELAKPAARGLQPASTPRRATREFALLAVAALAVALLGAGLAWRWTHPQPDGTRGDATVSLASVATDERASTPTRVDGDRVELTSGPVHLILVTHTSRPTSESNPNSPR